MISFEWDPVRAKEVAREEALEEMAPQVTLSLLKNKAPMHFITDATHLSVEEVEKIAREHQLTI